MAQPVLMAKFLPRKIQPRTSRMTFAHDEKAEADRVMMMYLLMVCKSFSRVLISI